MKKIIVAILAMALIFSSFGTVMADPEPVETGLLDLNLDEYEGDDLGLDFEVSTTTYALYVDFEMEAIDITAEIASGSAVEIYLYDPEDGIDDPIAEEETTDGSLVVTITNAALVLGSNELLVRVDDGDEETDYIVTINANVGILEGLQAGTDVIDDEEDDDFGMLEELDLDPEFESDVFDYGLSIYNNTEEIMLRLVLDEEVFDVDDEGFQEDWELVIMYEDDEIVTTHEALTATTGAIYTDMIDNLELGTSLLTVEVLFDDEEIAIYNIVVEQGLLLEDLIVSPPGIDFEVDDFYYNAGTVGYDVTTTAVTVVGTEGALLAVNGHEIDSGETTEVALIVGVNNIMVTSTVTDSDVTVEYTVRIRRDSEHGQQPDDNDEPGGSHLPPIPQFVMDRFRYRFNSWQYCEDVGEREGHTFEFRNMESVMSAFRNGSNLNKAIILDEDTVEDGKIVLDYNVFKFLSQHKVKFMFEYDGHEYMIPLFKMDLPYKLKGPFGAPDVIIEFEVDEGEFTKFDVSFSGVQEKIKGKKK